MPTYSIYFNLRMINDEFYLFKNERTLIGFFMLLKYFLPDLISNSYLEISNLFKHSTSD